VKIQDADCPVVTHLNKTDFNLRHYFTQRPVVLKNGAAWLDRSRLELPVLRQLLGDKPVKVAANVNGIFDYNPGAVTGEVKVLAMTFREAVDLIQSPEGKRHYMQQQEIKKQFPELLADAGRPTLLDATKVVTVSNLWIGAAGCKSPLHHDFLDNFLVQVSGRKRVHLFAPSDTPSLYPATGQNMPHCSRINVFDPDDASFPLYRRAQPAIVEIAAGDVLYIPLHWWHAVESLTESISLNYWWAGAPTLAWRGVLGLFSQRGRAEIWSFFSS